MKDNVFKKISVAPFKEEEVNELCRILGIERKGTEPVDAEITAEVTEDTEYMDWRFDRLATIFRPHVERIVFLLEEALLETVLALEAEPDAIEEPDLTEALDRIFDTLTALTSGERQESIHRFYSKAGVYMKRAYARSNNHLQYLEYLKEKAAK